MKPVEGWAVVGPDGYLYHQFTKEWAFERFRRECRSASTIEELEAEGYRCIRVTTSAAEPNAAPQEERKHSTEPLDHTGQRYKSNSTMLDLGTPADAAPRNLLLRARNALAQTFPFDSGEIMTLIGDIDAHLKESGE